MKIRKVLILISSSIILLLFIIASYSSYNMGVSYGVKNAEEIRERRVTDSLFHKKTPKTVSTILIENSNIKTEITSAGRVSSLNNISISSEVNGKIISKSSIKKGVKFQKGDVLFKIKNTDVKLLIEAKKSRFMNLLSLILADIKLDFPTEYSKWNSFFNSITLESPIGKIPKTATSKEKNFIVSKGIITEYLSIRSDEEKLKKYTVRATFDGVITRSYTDIGANVNIGTRVIDIIRNGKKEIELTVNTSEIKFIETGNMVYFTDNVNKFLGKIIRKGSFINANSQNISVFAEINTGSDLLYNGIYLNATIISSPISNVCRIPRRAILSDNKIFIVNSNNELEIKPINIIVNEKDNVIVDNINNNTLIVSEPLINAKEGMVVDPIIK